MILPLGNLQSGQRRHLAHFPGSPQIYMNPHPHFVREAVLELDYNASNECSRQGGHPEMSPRVKVSQIQRLCHCAS